MDDKDRLMRRILAENEKLKAELTARNTRRPLSAPATPRTPTSVPASVAATTASPASLTSSAPRSSHGVKRALSLLSPNSMAKSEPTDDEALKKKLRDMDHEKLLEAYDLSHQDCSCKTAVSVPSIASGMGIQHRCLQELSTRAVDARLRRLCERKLRSGKCGVPDWVHDEWRQLDRREILHLSLVEAIKAHGKASDAATRRLVKAGLRIIKGKILQAYGDHANLNCSALQAKFVQRVTIRVREKEKKITGLWCTEEKMRSELKYSKHLD